MEISEVHMFRPGHAPACYCPAAGATLYLGVLRGVLTVDADIQQTAVETGHFLVAPSAGITRVSDGQGDALALGWSVAGSWVAGAQVPALMDDLMLLVLDDVLGAGISAASPVVPAALAYLTARLGGWSVEVEVGGATAQLVEEVCRYLEANLDGDLSLADLCARFHCGRAVLSRLFRAAGLPSPMQHVAALRIRRASESLRQSDLSISNIAASVGFRDLPAFSRFFRTRTGYAPREYRRNCRWLL